MEAPSPDLPLSRQEKEEKKEKKEEKPKKKDEPGGPVFKAMFGRGTTIFAFAVLIGSFIMPPNGIGFALCWFKNMTGLPCPGCGLTRSIACITHLHFGEAVHYHPFGPVVYVLAILAVAMKFAGERRRQKLAAVFDRNRRLAGGIYWSVVGAFIVYGLVRLALVVRDPTLFTHV